MTALSHFGWNQIPTLLRGEADEIRRWTESRENAPTIYFLCVIAIGGFAFGATVGIWRAPLQAIFAGLKLPLVLLLTAIGNALLNGMLAPLFGVRMGFRQSFVAVLMSFAMLATILAGFAPLQAFVVWNIPTFDLEHSSAFYGYRFMQFTIVVAIGFAGVMANVRLMPLLRSMAGPTDYDSRLAAMNRDAPSPHPSPPMGERVPDLSCQSSAKAEGRVRGRPGSWDDSDRAAKRVLLAWLAGNLFLGSQICWVLRPFVGRPDDEVMFLGPSLFEGSFFETVFEAARTVIFRTVEVGP